MESFPKILIGIQCRLGSSRFPQKALYPIAGIPLIVRVIERLLPFRYPHVLALLVPSQDVAIFTQLLAQYHISIPIFGGDENNVLSRYFHAMKHFGDLPLIMRVTADNPLISLPLAEQLYQYHLNHACDLSHFIHNPLGTGVEIFTQETLTKTFNSTTCEYDCEHVTPYIYNNPQLFHIAEPISPYTDSSLSHLSVDHISDIELIERLLQHHPQWDISQKNPSGK